MGSKTNRRVPTGPSLPAGMTTHAGRTAQLAMDARHHLERRDLYRSKAAGPHAVSDDRLRGLEQAYDVAAARLEAAEAGGDAATTRGHLRLVLPDTKAEPSAPARPVGWNEPDFDVAVAVAMPLPGWPTEL